jgi:putative hydrolase of the HAD superfamily
MKPDLANYDAVIFDLFHTLVSLEGSYSPGEGVWDYLGISEQEWRGALFSDTDDRLRGRIVDPNDVVRDIVCKLVPDISDDRTKQASRIRAEQFHRALSNVQTHVVEAVGAIRSRGKRLGLISNADRIEISSWAESAIADCFDSAVFSCVVGFIKPERQIYSTACESLGVPAHRCLFVGDGGNDELAGARRAGMDAAITLEFIQDPDSDAMMHRRAQADFEIARISDLL